MSYFADGMQIYITISENYLAICSKFDNECTCGTTVSRLYPRTRVSKFPIGE